MNRRLRQGPLWFCAVRFQPFSFVAIWFKADGIDRRGDRQQVVDEAPASPISNATSGRSTSRRPNAADPKIVGSPVTTRRPGL